MDNKIMIDFYQKSEKKSNMEKTALEWLVEQMKTWGDLPRWQKDDIIQQAKEMEEKQIKDAYLYGSAYGIDVYNGFDPNNYYKEIFKSEQ